MSENKMIGELPSTSELFQKHFNQVSVGLFDPRVKGFFEELNEVCKEEDRRKAAIDKAKLI